MPQSPTLLQQSFTFHTILQQKFNQNLVRVTQLKLLSVRSINLFNNFSSQLKEHMSKLFESQKNDQTQNESLIFLSKYIMDVLNEIKKRFTHLATKLTNQMLDPLNQFIKNQELTKSMILRESQENIYVLQNNTQYLKELTKNYDITCKNPVSQQQVNQLTKIYHLQIQKCNQKYCQVKHKYTQILNKVDLYNSSRINFMLKQQIQFIRTANSFVKEQSIEKVLKGYEQLNMSNSYNNSEDGQIKDNKSMSLIIKDELREKIGKLNLLEPNSVNLDQIWDLPFYKRPSFQQSKDKRLVDDFVAIFTSKINMKAEDNKNFQQARNLIVNKIEWIKYFLNRLQASLHTDINLPVIKYREITALIKYIFAHVAQQGCDDSESILYSILYISYRVKYNSDYLITLLGKQQDFWKDYRVWYGIIDYIKKSKYGYKKPAQIKSQENISSIQDYLRPSKYLKYGEKLLNKDTWLRPKNSIKKIIASDQKNLRTQKTNEKVIHDARDYGILCQINFFMIRLQLEEKFVFNFILQTRSQYGISDQNIKKLIKTHCFNRFNSNNKLGSLYIKRKKRLQKKYNDQLNTSNEKWCWAIGKALKYILPSPNQKCFINLLTLNKYFFNHLRDRVQERFLIHDTSLTQAKRLAVYTEICRAPYTKEVYKRMLKQMPQASQHTEIIFLDAKRSMSWNQSLRTELMEVLGVYAFYHPEVGYLQGMNYLCENILKLTTDTYIVYSIFEYVMNTFYQNMYTGKFDGLKIKIYQTMRILKIQNSLLYNHFESEKIEGQHFLISWSITLWGEMSGQLSWILWDGFILKGWKWFIKTCLWLLKKLQPQLLSMNFQQMMKCFGDLSNSIFGYDLNQLNHFGIKKEKIKKQIDQIQIQSQVLKDIQKQYQMKINTMNQFLNKLQSKK